MADSTYAILKNAHLTIINGTFHCFDITAGSDKITLSRKMEEK